MNVTRLALILVISVSAPLAGAAQQQPTTREMNLMGWQEFAELVPSHVQTVLLATGTLEPHGVLPNGSDNLAPEAMARALAERLDALVAPTLNYGVTGSLAAYPGAFRITPASYTPFVTDILVGLARNGFRNVIILNGHGGEQTALLHQAAADVSERHGVRTLVINWWSLASDETFAVFGENGGHAGNNETAYVQAVVPEHVHPERYTGSDMTTPYPAGSEWAAFPFPSSIGLYEPGQGEPTFDPDQARDYFARVNERVASLIEDVIRKWELAEAGR